MSANEKPSRMLWKLKQDGAYEASFLGDRWKQGWNMGNNTGFIGFMKQQTMTRIWLEC